MKKNYFKPEIKMVIASLRTTVLEGSSTVDPDTPIQEGEFPLSKENILDGLFD